MKVVYHERPEGTKFPHVLSVLGTETEAHDFATWAHREYDDGQYFVETFCMPVYHENVRYPAITYLEVPTSTEAVRLMLMWG